MDLSKVFDTLNHGLLMAELEAHGFSKNSLNYIQSYLGNRLQRTNVNNNYSIGENHDTKRNILNNNFLSLQKRFYDNYMVLNPGKCCYEFKF